MSDLNKKEFDLKSIASTLVSQISHMEESGINDFKKVDDIVEEQIAMTTAGIIRFLCSNVSMQTSNNVEFTQVYNHAMSISTEIIALINEDYIIPTPKYELRVNNAVLAIMGFISGSMSLLDYNKVLNTLVGS